MALGGVAEAEAEAEALDPDAVNHHAHQHTHEPGAYARRPLTSGGTGTRGSSRGRQHKPGQQFTKTNRRHSHAHTSALPSTDGAASPGALPPLQHGGGAGSPSSQAQQAGLQPRRPDAHRRRSAAARNVSPLQDRRELPHRGGESGAAGPGGGDGGGAPLPEPTQDARPALAPLPRTHVPAGSPTHAEPLPSPTQPASSPNASRRGSVQLQPLASPPATSALSPVHDSAQRGSPLDVSGGLGTSAKSLDPLPSRPELPIDERGFQGTDLPDLPATSGGISPSKRQLPTLADQPTPALAPSPAAEAPALDAPQPRAPLSPLADARAPTAGAGMEAPANPAATAQLPEPVQPRRASLEPLAAAPAATNAGGNTMPAPAPASPPATASNDVNEPATLPSAAPASTVPEAAQGPPPVSEPTEAPEATAPAPEAAPASEAPAPAPEAAAASEAPEPASEAAVPEAPEPAPVPAPAAAVTNAPLGKFCTNCGCGYGSATAKFCSDCGTKRAGT